MKIYFFYDKEKKLFLKSTSPLLTSWNVTRRYTNLLSKAKMFHTNNIKKTLLFVEKMNKETNSNFELMERDVIITEEEDIWKKFLNLYLNQDNQLTWEETQMMHSYEKKVSMFGSCPVKEQEHVFRMLLGAPDIYDTILFSLIKDSLK